MITVRSETLLDGGGLAISITNINYSLCTDDASSNLIHTTIEENRAMIPKRSGGGLYMKFDSLCKPINVLLNNFLW